MPFKIARSTALRYPGTSLSADHRRRGPGTQYRKNPRRTSVKQGFLLSTCTLRKHRCYEPISCSVLLSTSGISTKSSVVRVAREASRVSTRIYSVVIMPNKLNQESFGGEWRKQGGMYPCGLAESSCNFKVCRFCAPSRSVPKALDSQSPSQVLGKCLKTMAVSSKTVFRAVRPPQEGA